MVTDYDCVFEEAITVSLLDKALKPISSRTLGGPYGSYLFKNIAWSSPHSFVLQTSSGESWKFVIRPWGIPFLRPRLDMKKCHPDASVKK